MREVRLALLEADVSYKVVKDFVNKVSERAMVNEFYANGVSRGDMKYLLLLLSPFAPHIVEELWEDLGFARMTGRMASQNNWPSFDETKTAAATVEMAVQVGGKLRGTVILPADSDEETVMRRKAKGSA